MSFRKYGGTQFASSHNIVKSNVNTTDSFYVTKNLGQPNTYINFESDVSGNMNIYGNLDVSGNLSVSEDVDINGKLYVKENIDCSGNLYVQENIDCIGNVDINGDVDINGKLHVQENIDCSGNVTGEYMTLSSGSNYTSAPNGVVPKSYVDAVANGLTPLPPCLLCSNVGPITLSGYGQSIDGFTITSVYDGSAVLINAQGGNNVANINNGVYVVGSGAWQRVSYLDTGDSATSTVTLILQGITFSNYRFVCTTGSTTSPAFIDVSPLLWSPFEVPFSLGQGLSRYNNGGNTVFQVDSSLNFINYLDNTAGPNPGTINIGNYTPTINISNISNSSSTCNIYAANTFITGNTVTNSIQSVDPSANINIGTTLTYGDIFLGGSSAANVALNWGGSSNSGNLTFRGGNFNLESTGNYDQQSGAIYSTNISTSQTSGIMNIGTSATRSGAININTGATATAPVNISSATSGNAPITIGSTGSSSQVVNINGANITVGSNNTSTFTLNPGATGAFSLGTNMTGGSITIGNNSATTSTTEINIGNGIGQQGALNIGSIAGNGRAINIGNLSTGGVTTIQGATLTLNPAATGALNLGSSMTSGSIQIGGSTGGSTTIAIGNGPSQTGAITINRNGGGNTNINGWTILGSNNILNASGDIQIDTTGAAAGRGMYLGGSISNGPVQIAAGNNQTGAISIGTGTSAKTITIGSSASTVAINGTTTVNGTTNFTGGIGTTTLTASGLITASGGITVTGTTNINTTGSSSTNIGNGTGITYFNGKVGIGITNPTYKLSLGTDSSYYKLALYDGGTSNFYGLGAINSNLTFGAALTTTGTPQMVLNANGRVGIGTTNPQYLLDVSGNGCFSNSIYLYNGANNSVINENGSTLNLVNNNVNGKVVISNSAYNNNNFNFGFDSSGNTLTFNSDGSSDTGFIRWYSPNDSNSYLQIGTTDNAQFGAAENIYFTQYEYSNNTTYVRMRFDGTGVWINPSGDTYFTAASTYSLNVNGNVNITNGLITANAGLTVTGTTNINTSGTSSTNIGNITGNTKVSGTLVVNNINSDASANDLNLGQNITTGNINIGATLTTGDINLGGSPDTQVALNWGGVSNSGNLNFQGGSFNLDSTGNYTQQSGATFQTNISANQTSGELAIGTLSARTGAIYINTGATSTAPIFISSGTNDNAPITIGSTASTTQTCAMNAITTFSKIPSCAVAPTSAYNLCNKNYVDSAIGGTSALGTNNTWTGANAFNNTAIGSLTSAATQPGTSDNSTKIPTTAWVQSAISTVGSSQWTTSGSNIYYNSTGNVGIGTIPSSTLDVSGNARIRGRTYFGIDNPGGGSNDTAYMEYVAISGEQTTLRINVQNDTNDNINLNPSGNVGINTDTPAYKLDVTGTLRTTGLITANAGLTVTGTTNFNGSVGIGITNPAYTLDVNGPIHLTQNLYMNNSYQIWAANSSGGQEQFLWPRWSDNASYLNYGSSGFYIRNNSSTTTMFMNNANQVGIGTTSPAYTLDVNGNIRAIAGINTNTLTASGLITANGGITASTLTSSGLITANGGITSNTLTASGLITANGGITVTGRVGIGTTSPAYTLDVSGVLHTNADAYINSIRVGQGSGGNNFYNTAVGISTLNVNTSGSLNTAIGYEALLANTTGFNNTAIGFETLMANSSGNYNTAIGSGTLLANNTGSYNTATGVNALYSNTGSNNTAIGYKALGVVEYNNNTAVGFYAGYSLSGSSTNNTFLGYNTGVQNAPTYTLSYNYSTAVGYNATITTSNQIVLGTANEKIYIPGSYVGIGGVFNTQSSYALDVSGNVNVTNGGLTSSGLITANSGITASTLTSSGLITANSGLTVTGATNINTTGTSTTTIGNTNGITIFNSKVGIGPSANPPQFTLDVSGGSIGAWSVTTYSSITSTNGNMFAYNITANSTLSGVNINASNSITSPSYNSDSDYRIKNDVTPLDEKFTVDKLRPVTYNNTKLDKQDIGLIAHELQEVYPFLVNGEKDGENLQSVNYTGLIGILIKEIQELKERVKKLENPSS